MGVRLEQTATTVYSGIDPTADSAHVGNLLPMICLLRFLVRGHNIIPLIGGATGPVGDPSGRSLERQALSSDVLQHNIQSLSVQMAQFFQRGVKYASKRVECPSVLQNRVHILNNADWTGKLSLMDFLSDTGRLARVNTMLNRESVKVRMEQEQGISFTEFTYQLLQAYDFWYLYQYHECTVQIGGSDQWGNIVAGIDLIRRKAEILPNVDVATTHTYGLTLPLVTTVNGEKFGKSMGNAIWLDDCKTSIFDFYQFFMRTQDADVERYLCIFTFLSMNMIKNIMTQHQKQPEQRIAQRRLADEVTEMVHTEEGKRQAQVKTSVLYPLPGDSSLHTLDASVIIAAFAGDSRLKQLPYSSIIARVSDDKNDKATPDVARVAMLTGACRSRSEAIRLSRRGGLYVNGVAVEDAAAHKLVEKDLIDGRLVVLRVGKREYYIIEAISD